MTIAVPWLRRRARGDSNEMDQSSTLLIAGWAIGIAVQLSICWAAAVSLWAGLAMVHVLFAAVQLPTAVLLDKRVWPSIPTVLLAGAPLPFFPDYAMQIAGVTAGGAMVFLGLRLRHLARAG